MNAQKTLVPLALFALAFTVALLVRHPSAVAPGRVRAESAGAGMAGGASRSNVAQASSVPGSTDSFAPGGADRRATREPEPGIPHDAASWGQARDATDREVARRDVASSDAGYSAPAAADSQGATQSLGEARAALEYGTPNDRARAVQALAATARNGIDVAKVRSLLRLAAADEDPDVAARAQAEYEALAEHEDP